MLRKLFLITVALLLAPLALAQSVDEIIAKNSQARGGISCKYKLHKISGLFLRFEGRKGRSRALFMNG